jgi:membrane protease YdiL (CAAX protease family)
VLSADGEPAVTVGAGSKGVTGAASVGILGVGLISALSFLIPNVWYRLAAAYTVLVPCALRTRPGWRDLWRPAPRRVVQGVLAAAVLYVLGWIGHRVLTSVPALAADVPRVLAWKDSVRPALALPLLAFIVAGEEIVWRCAVGLPLAARLGPSLGSVAAAALFAAAHLAFGMPLLLAAAFALGLFWSALVVKTRSAVPAFVSHVLWDLAVLYVAPYGV